MKPRLRHRCEMPVPIGCVVLLVARMACPATVYYVDGEHGDDARGGVAMDQAWKSLERVNARHLPARRPVALQSGHALQPANSTPRVGPDGGWQAAAHRHRQVWRRAAAAHRRRRAGARHAAAAQRRVLGSAGPRDHQPRHEPRAVAHRRARRHGRLWQDAPHPPAQSLSSTT